ncbi:outer membrane protein assembly factor BamC [Mariprofundus sp. EBB-1]|uniref:outer membrane protein assembly factor BamC n=1 Tax=Mariprofundus sp. EBB-1 TaxID=2650971 RepID=UPI00137B6BFA|nr:outer membrane protein assembly factor BamC [Mariprofundus sp. EBB-1]
MPQLFWDTDDGSGKNSSSIYGTKTEKKAEARAPLEVPPELRADIALPMANEVSTNSSQERLPEKYTKAVAGKAVALDARAYTATADQVFSAVVDAMTSLNMPIESVDSPSGIVTTDWVQRGLHNNNILGSMLGQGSNVTRHRYVVRVYRIKTGQQEKTRLEVRALLQRFSNRHWVSMPMNQKHTAAFFTTVEEQLGRLQGNTVAP